MTNTTIPIWGFQSTSSPAPLQKIYYPFCQCRFLVHRHSLFNFTQTTWFLFTRIQTDKHLNLSTNGKNNEQEKMPSEKGKSFRNSIPLRLYFPSHYNLNMLLEQNWRVACWILNSGNEVLGSWVFFFIANVVWLHQNLSYSDVVRCYCKYIAVNSFQGKLTKHFNQKWYINNPFTLVFRYKMWLSVWEDNINQKTHKPKPHNSKLKKSVCL